VDDPQSIARYGRGRELLEMKSDRMHDYSAHWSVTVERNGEIVVTIESNSLSGIEIGPEEERIIRLAARHLLSFIGE
jgi:hypothetical protein